ncbi:MAG TPA: hypothetical protein VM347_11540 [Nonomuraea sp.]|nr:hypothetical protein [Nonomuraea sp.]
MNRKDRSPVSGYASKAAGVVLPVVRKRRCNAAAMVTLAVTLDETVPPALRGAALDLAHVLTAHIQQWDAAGRPGISDWTVGFTRSGTDAAPLWHPTAWAR